MCGSGVRPLLELLCKKEKGGITFLVTAMCMRVCHMHPCVGMCPHVLVPLIPDCSCEMLAEMLWTLRQMLRQHDFLHQQVATNLSSTPATPNQSLASQMHKFATAQLQTLVKR